MRKSLEQSLADSPADGFERYPKGSVVICNACAMPIYKLDRGIGLGDKAGRSAHCFKPLTGADLLVLEMRPDIDAGVRAKVRTMTPEDRTVVTEAHEPRSGDPMLCPVCKSGFPQVLSVEKDETLDRAYVIELVTVPPEGQKNVAIRGKQIGATKEWVH